jgi:hypothetical protein
MMTLVDLDDYDWIKEYLWHTDGRYARRRTAEGVGLPMQNEIMKPPSGMVVDHINRNGFDNRRENLRVVSQRENAANTGPMKNKAVRYKGVHCAPSIKKAWTSAVNVNGVRRHLGTLRTPEEAAITYDIAALEGHGEYAYTNFEKDLVREMRGLTPEERMDRLIEMGFQGPAPPPDIPHHLLNRKRSTSGKYRPKNPRSQRAGSSVGNSANPKRKVYYISQELQHAVKHEAARLAMEGLIDLRGAESHVVEVAVREYLKRKEETPCST